MVRKYGKVILSVIGILVILNVTIIYSGLRGNTVGRYIATKKIEAYVDNKFEGTFSFTKAQYEFKAGGYSSDIQSEDSIDTHFSVHVKDGEVVSDTYYEVENNYTTYSRIENEYKEFVSGVIEKGFPIETDLTVGTYRVTDEYGSGVDLNTLERDKDYDVKEFAKKHGHIVVYTKGEKKDKDKISKEVKEYLDEEGVPFKILELTLEQDDYREEFYIDYNKIK